MGCFVPSLNQEFYSIHELEKYLNQVREEYTRDYIQQHKANYSYPAEEYDEETLMAIYTCLEVKERRTI